MNRCKAREFTGPLPRKVTGAATLPQHKYNHDRGNSYSMYSDKATVGGDSCGVGFAGRRNRPQRTIRIFSRLRCSSSTSDSSGGEGIEHD